MTGANDHFGQASESGWSLSDRLRTRGRSLRSAVEDLSLLLLELVVGEDALVSQFRELAKLDDDTVSRRCGAVRRTGERLSG